MERKLSGKMNIKKIKHWVKRCLAMLSNEYYALYPSKNSPPWWLMPIIEPKPIDWKDKQIRNTKFNITENVCGLTVNYGMVKVGCLSSFVVYDKKGKQISLTNNEISWTYKRVHNALADILQHYNAESITLQAKVLEKSNYYNVAPRIYGFALYIDGVEQEIVDMAFVLRKYNIEVVPIFGLNKTINEETKENYSAQSKISNVNNKGIICTNRQKSLSFLL